MSQRSSIKTFLIHHQTARHTELLTASDYSKETQFMAISCKRFFHTVTKL